MIFINVIRISEQLAKRVFYSELEDGKREHGGQVLSYIDVLKKNKGANRQEWRALAKAKVHDFELRRRCEIDTERDNLKAQPSVCSRAPVVRGFSQWRLTM